MAQPKPLAVLDSNIVIYALLDEASADDNALEQKEAVLEKLDALSKTHRFGIPAVVLAELPDDKLKSPQLTTFASAVALQFRILALGKEGAEVAAKLCAENVRAKPSGRTRDGVKLDAIVVGTALEHDAALIISENGDDFEKFTANLNIELVVPSRDRVAGQKVLPLFKDKS